MYTKIRPVFYTVLAVPLLLSACAWQKTGVGAADPAMAVCNDIRQQIISNNYSNNTPDRHGNSPTVAAKLYKDYDHYNCPALVDENKDNPLPSSYRSGNNIIQLTNQQ